MASISTCIICNKPETKYKCSKCKVPSCSLNCYKQHQSSCSAVPRLAVTEPEEDQSEISEFHLSSPAKVDKAELEALFKQYPELRSELQKIYQSLQRDGSDMRNDARNHGNRVGKANSGFDLGLRLLRDVLDRDDATSRGLEAFMKLVAQREMPMG